MSKKVAIITGGASGIGLAVATHLATTSKEWEITILDLNSTAGALAASALQSTTFIHTDVNDYASLSSAIHQTFTKNGSQLDFVFANAGVIERDSFYDTKPSSGTADPISPPPPPNLLTLDINLKSVIHTTWLTQHYMRQNQARKGGVLVMTSSIGGLYALPQVPIYAAAKHGLLGFMRSIASPLFESDAMRVNAICPGTVRTNLMPQAAWDAFGEGGFTPVEKVVAAVIMLLEDEALWGRVVEVSGEKWWFREQYECKDPQMAKLLGIAPGKE